MSMSPLAAALIALLAFVALSAATESLRRGPGANMNVVWFFALLLLGVALSQLHPFFAGSVAATLEIGSVLMFIAYPIFLLRIVDQFVDVPVGIWVVAALGNLTVLAAIAFSLGVPLNPPVVLAVGLTMLLYIAVVTTYSAYAFGKGAARTRGLVSRHMRLASTGASLLTLAVLGALVLAAKPSLASLPTLLTIASVGFFALAFTPPRPLSSAWLAIEVRDFLATVEADPGDSPRTRADVVLRALADSARQAVGGHAALIILRERDRPVIASVDEGIPVPDAQHVRAFVQGRPELGAAAWPEMSANQRALARQLEARVIATVPIASMHALHGVLFIGLSGQPLFLADGLRSLELMARQVAAIIEAADGSQREQEFLIKSHNLERADLEREKRSLEEANRLKSHFLAQMSHELRTPMNGILGFSELLAKGRLGTTDERAREAAGDIHKAASHLHRIIDDILDLAKVEAGRLRFSPESVIVEELASEVLSGMMPEITAKGLRADLRVDPAVAHIHADATRLRQVLYNYVSNAVRYARDGGRIALRVRPANWMVRFEVQDDGPGIDPIDQRRLFQPFEQINPRPGQKGTGLGLALVRELVEAQGGRVGVSSRPGQGAMFWAEMPVRAGNTVVHRSAAAGQVPWSGPLRVQSSLQRRNQVPVQTSPRMGQSKQIAGAS